MRVRVEGLFVLGGHPLLAKATDPIVEILCQGSYAIVQGCDGVHWRSQEARGFKEQYALQTDLSPICNGASD